MKVVIGSKNPAKIQAVEDAFRKLFPEEELTFTGVDVPSGISDQPMDDEETMEGAYNRAKAALAADPTANYGVGLEGGMHNVKNAWFTGNFACVVSDAGKIGFGISPRVVVPNELVTKVKQGFDLSSATHEVLGITDIGKKEGILGLTTNGLVTRSSASRDAIICALGSVRQHKEGNQN